jgi:signal transduction histidine kinase
MEVFRMEAFGPGVIVRAIHPDDLDRVIDAWGEAMLGAAYDIEHRVLVGGETRWVRNCAVIERDAQGNILSGMGMLQDITVAKSAQMDIERLNHLYRLLSRVNEAIVRAPAKHELFEAVCQAAIESGLFRFAWVGMLDGNWVIPVAHGGVEQGYMSGKFGILIDDERTGNGPTGRAIREDAHVIAQDIEHDPSMAPWRDDALMRGFRASAAFPIHEAGTVVGAVNVYAMEAQFFTPDIVDLMLELAADISFALNAFAERERRELAEREVLHLNAVLERRVADRTRQLEMTNKELDAFSYSVSHDLRAPLRSIDGFSQMLLKKHHGQLDAQSEDYLERICRATRRMGQLIDDLLRLAHVTRSTLKQIPVDLSKLAHETVEELHKAHPERTVEFAAQTGLTVHGDPGLLRVLMENLIGNAWKYTGKKAHAKIEFGAYTRDGEPVFFVRDNGAGFNMDYAGKLFGAFQRLHGENEFQGTGIGLATVQRIVHRHGGTVWAEAREGEGATFYFTLPQPEYGIDIRYAA